MRDRKAHTKRTTRRTSFREAADAAILDLKVHMESLVEDIKTHGEELMQWMVSKMQSSFKDDVISSKPSRKRKGQPQHMKNYQIPRWVRPPLPTNNGEGVVAPKEEKNVVINAIAAVNNEKQKRKQKLVDVEAYQWTNAAGGAAAAAHGYLTLPSVLTQQQAENSERNPSADGNGMNFGQINALNSGINPSTQSHQLNSGVHLSYQSQQLNPGVNLSSQSHQLNSGVNLSSQSHQHSGVNLSPQSHQRIFDLRPLQNDAVIAKTGLRNVSNYEHNTSLPIGNGNGFTLPLPQAPQGSNDGNGMQNTIPSQFGVKCVTQAKMISGAYRGSDENFPTYVERHNAMKQEVNKCSTRQSRHGITTPKNYKRNLQPRYCMGKPQPRSYKERLQSMYSLARFQ